MNAVILPGVHLADGTVVGAGSVVTRSFLKPNCVIAGIPATTIKERNSAISEIRYTVSCFWF